VNTRFITFEGVDGCGKSTQMKLTAEWLAAVGEQVCTTFEPGDHSLGQEVRHLLLSNGHSPVPETELLLFLADRAQHVCELILPALQGGQWVLCDRFTDSTLAYQMAGRRLDAAALDGLLRFAELGIRPSFTLWMDLPVQKALERIRLRTQAGGGATRIDEETLSFHTRVRQGFARIYSREAERIYRIDASGSVDKIQQRIRQALRSRFSELS